MLHQVKKLFIRNKEGVTGFQEKYNDYKFANKMKAKLARIPEGRDIIDFIEKHDVKIQADCQMDKLARFTYCRVVDNKTGIEHVQEPRILINPFMAEGDEDYMMHNLLHEVWHIKQHMEHVGRLPVLMTFPDMCLQTRVLEADAESFAIEMSYKYKEAGHPKAWHMAMQSCYGLMAERYEKSVNENAENLHNGYARRAAFDAWFSLRDLKHRYDKASADIQLSEEKFHREKPGVYHEQRRLNMSELQAIGDLSRVNYLKLPATANLQHPHYTHDIHTGAKHHYYSETKPVRSKPRHPSRINLYRRPK